MNPACDLASHWWSVPLFVGVGVVFTLLLLSALIGWMAIKGEDYRYDD